MGYPAAWLQHQARDAAYRNDCAHPLRIDNNEGTVDNVKLAAFDKQD
jgi:hypothetical protein